MTERIDRMPRRGFTLVEMMAVLLLVGLLAGTAALAFARPLRAARARQAVEQIGALDASARQNARRAGRDVEVMIDLYEQQIVRSEVRDGPARETLRAPVPTGVRIDQARTGDNAPADSSRLVVRYSSKGISRSYALRLVGPGFDRWLVVAGLSGQVTLVNDEQAVEQILARASGRDAD